MKKQVIIGLIFGAVFLGLAMWGVPLSELGDAFKRLDLWVLPPLAVLFMVQQLLRAWRQQVLVNAVQPDSTFWEQFGILCMSFFCINTFPARLGELVRPWLLLERSGVPLGAGFGVVFVERVLDLASALVMVLAVAWFVDVPPVPLEIFDTRIELVELGRKVATGLLPPLLGMMVALVLFRRQTMAGLARLVALAERLFPFSSVRRAGRLGLTFAEHFVDGLEAVRQPGRLAMLLTLTAATWGLTGTLYVILARGLGLGHIIGYGEGIAVLAITMLGIAIPAPPGMAGVYEAFVRGALALFGIVGGELDGVAMAFALVIHWWIYLVQAASAAWFFSRAQLDPRTLFRQARETWEAA
jgi:uncharacterized membrane protein YbhN (UPF0104 family)